MTSCNYNCTITKRLQKDYIKFNYNGLEEVRKIFEINDSNMNVLETIGNHELDKYLKEKEREHYVLLFNEKKYTNNSGRD